MPATATPREQPPHQAQVDAPPVDVATIRATIKRALTHGPAPRYAALEELESLLRRHIDLLLPYTETAGASTDLLDGVRQHRSESMGNGLISACRHVRQLAHDAQALLPYAEEVGQ